jgi:hypothetical protein
MIIDIKNNLENSEWSVIQFLGGDSLPYLIRLKHGVNDNPSYSDYKIKLGIAVPVVEHNSEIQEFKYAVEDYLEDYFKGSDIGIFVCIINGMEGQRFVEFLSYVKPEKIDYEKFHKDLQDKFPNYEIQMYAEEESNFETHNMYLQMVADGDKN